MRDILGGTVMIDNLMYMMQTTTVEQLKAEIDKNTFVDKNLKDFNKGKEMINNLLELSFYTLNGAFFLNLKIKLLGEKLIFLNE